MIIEDDCSQISTRYCPAPLAVLLCGKPVQFLLNIILTLFFWIPGVIHAILVVNAHLADKRTDRIVKAIKQQKT